MPSSLFQSTNKSIQLNPQMIQQAKSIMNNANSPQMMMLKGLLGGKGMNAEQTVRSICQQRGINVDEFMSQLK